MRTGRNNVRFFDAGKRRTCAGVRGRNYIGSFGKIIRANGDNFSGVSGCTNSLWVRSLIAGRSNHDNTGIPKLINFADKSTVFGIGMPVIGAILNIYIAFFYALLIFKNPLKPIHDVMNGAVALTV